MKSKISAHDFFLSLIKKFFNNVDVKWKHTINMNIYLTKWNGNILILFVRIKSFNKCLNIDMTWRAEYVLKMIFRRKQPVKSLLTWLGNNWSLCSNREKLSDSIIQSVCRVNLQTRNLRWVKFEWTSPIVIQQKWATAYKIRYAESIICYRSFILPKFGALRCNYKYMHNVTYVRSFFTNFES